jgi:hypothetical protein
MTFSVEIINKRMMIMVFLLIMILVMTLKMSMKMTLMMKEQQASRNQAIRRKEVMMKMKNMTTYLRIPARRIITMIINRNRRKMIRLQMLINSNKLAS